MQPCNPDYAEEDIHAATPDDIADFLMAMQQKHGRKVRQEMDDYLQRILSECLTHDVRVWDRRDGTAATLDGIYTGEDSGDLLICTKYDDNVIRYCTTEKMALHNRFPTGILNPDQFS